MLNYIWAGLIVFSFVFAVANDALDLKHDTYRNSKPLIVSIVGDTSAGGPHDVIVKIAPSDYTILYGIEEPLQPAYAASLLTTARGRELHFPAGAVLPPRLAKVRDITSGDDPKWLLAEVTTIESNGLAEIRFRPVRWVAIQAIGAAAISFAKDAVTLTLGLIGVLALFLGVMQIAEKAGLIALVVRFTGPPLRLLFPSIPKGHPALAMISLNLTANMLGLGNAATPFGIKAMEELQKLNKTTDTATNAMVMLLAMNTAGVQLLPPMMLYAVMGLRASELYFPILIVTGVSLVVAVVSVTLLGRLRGYRLSDPDRLPEPEVAR